MSILGTAEATVGDAKAFVTSQLAVMQGRTDSFLSEALGVINALESSVNVDDIGVTPAVPDLSVALDTFNLPAINATSFGSVSAVQPGTPTLDAVPSIGAVTFDDFASSVAFNIPDAPVVSGFVAPDRPTLSDVVIPGTPTLVRPLLPDLDTIVIPSFTFPTIDAFSIASPEFEGSTPVTHLQWSEPVYATEILDEVIDKLRLMWDGGTGLPPAVEQAMWERAASREDQALAREVANVATEFSSRGFTMPPGMQVARVDALREEGLVKKLALNREITIEVAKFQIENLRIAVERGIAAENVLANIFLNGAQRIFEAAKFEVQAQLDLYGAQAAVFNARMNGYAVQAQVYKTNLDARLATIEVYKAQLQGEIARGTINEQRVKAYSAMVDAMRADVEVYRAQMEGAKVQADVVRAQIEGYKVDVDAYSATIGADKLRFDAYDSRVRGESAKAGIVDAEARAYGAAIQGKTAQIEADVQRSRAAIDSNRIQLEGYRAALESAQTTAQLQVAGIDAASKAYIADTQRYVAMAGAEEGRARVEVAVQETALRTNLGLYQAELGRYQANIDAAIRKTNLQIEALKAAGQISATLAAGAMAAVNIGATMSGSGSVTAGLGIGLNKSANETYSYNVSSQAAGDGSPLDSASLASQPW